MRAVARVWLPQPRTPGLLTRTSWKVPRSHLPTVTTAMLGRSEAWEPRPGVTCAPPPAARSLFLSVPRAVARALRAAATRGPALSPGFWPVSGHAGPSPRENVQPWPTAPGPELPRGGCTAPVCGRAARVVM